jgi:hypothetical protein
MDWLFSVFQSLWTVAGDLVAHPAFKVLLPLFQLIAAIGATIVLGYGTYNWRKRRRSGGRPAHAVLADLDRIDPVLALPSQDLPRGEVRASRVLQPAYRIVPYADTHHQLSDLLSWCRDGSPGLRTRLYVGSGGSGKTRLLIEALHALKGQSWKVGFLRSSGEYARLDLHKRHKVFDGNKPILAVIDYAENRAEEAETLMHDLLSIQEQHPQRRIRIVLLARSKGEWLDDIGPNHADTVGEHLSYVPIDVLNATDKLIINTLAERDELYERSRQGFSAVIPYRANNASFSPKPDLADDTFARPLIIQIKALLSLIPNATAEAGGNGENLSEQDKLLAALLRLEERAWLRLDKAKKNVWHEVFVLLTLAGEIDDAEAGILLNALATGEDVDGPSNGAVNEIEREPSGRIIGLVPDILGEHLVATHGKAVHLKLFNHPSVSRESVRNAIEVICRIHGAESRHGRTIRAAAARILVDVVRSGDAKRSFFYAYLANVISRRPRVLEQLLAVGLAPEEAVSFVLRVGEFADLLCLMTSAPDRMAAPITSGLSKTHVNELVARSFELMVSKRPALSAPTGSGSIWKHVDSSLLIRHFDRWGLTSSYTEFDAVVGRLPPKRADAVFARVSDTTVNALHENTIAGPRSITWLVEHLLGTTPSARHLRTMMGEPRLVDLVTRKGLALFSKIWRSKEISAKTLRQALERRAKQFRPEEWSAWLLRGSVYDLALFLDGPMATLPQAVQKRVCAAAASKAAVLVHNCATWYHLRRAQNLLRSAAGTASIDVQKASQPVKRIVGELNHAISEFINQPRFAEVDGIMAFGRPGLMDRVPAFEIFWERRPELRNDLARRLWNILPDPSLWQADNHYLLTGLMTIIRQSVGGLFSDADVRRLYMGVAEAAAKPGRHGLSYYALIFWNLAALWRMRREAFPDQREPLTPRAIESLIGALEASTQDGNDVQGILFVAGVCDFMSPKSRDKLRILLTGKRLKLPNDIGGELTKRTFISSFFCLRGLDLTRKENVMDTYADLLWRQAETSPWTDASLEWLMAALPSRKKPRTRQSARPAQAQRVV